MKISKSTIYAIGIGLIVFVFGYIMLDNDESNVVYGPGSGEVQEIVIGMKNYNYFPNAITVEVNRPVRISLDSSVTGCFRDFTIRDFKIHKYLKTPAEYIEFTPTKKGNYAFACSMGMGTGLLIVK